MNMGNIIVIVLSVVASGCSPAPVPVSQSARDPSSPNAPEGSSHAAHVATATDKQAGVVYACPMHPEVTSGAPGVCPKCNMNLVPKK